MKDRKITRVVCFFFGLVLIFVSQINTMIHFQWNVTLWPDVLNCVAACLLTLDMVLQSGRRTSEQTDKRKILLWCIAVITGIAMIGNAIQIAGDDTGIVSLCMNLFILMTLLLSRAVFHCTNILFSKAKTVIFAAVFVFVQLCSVITPVCITWGARVGHMIDGQVMPQRVPVSYALPVSVEAGTLQHMEYVTMVYDTDGRETGYTEEKALWVYLPFGYDESEQYDILYLMHGGGEDEDAYFGSRFSKFKNLIDHMIMDRMIPPVIVVTPCISYQNDVYDNIDTLPVSFQYELRNTIIPLVESTYSTHAQGTSEQELEASRTHRMIGGFSYGGIISLNAFCYNLDYFSGFIPMSNRYSNAEAMVSAIEERYHGHFGKSDFTVCMTTGGKEMDYEVVTTLFRVLTEEYGEYFQNDPFLKSGNTAIYIGENHRHGSEFVMEYLYVYLPMLMGGNHET